MAVSGFAARRAVCPVGLPFPVWCFELLDYIRCMLASMQLIHDRIAALDKLVLETDAATGLEVFNQPDLFFPARATACWRCICDGREESFD